jgi:hypothetical protein
VAGTFKACTSAAGLSYVAIGGDFFGGGFFYLANQSKKYADYLEGKKKTV